jgi:hypothetical protein
MADILISMNKTTEKLWKYADEWEKTPEHFDGVNPFCVAIHAVRQITNAPELLNEQKHGHWIVDGRFLPSAQCSACEETYVGDCRTFNYCPNCGAAMDEEVKQDD